MTEGRDSLQWDAACTREEREEENEQVASSLRSCGVNDPALSSSSNVDAAICCAGSVTDWQSRRPNSTRLATDAPLTPATSRIAAFDKHPHSTADVIAHFANQAPPLLTKLTMFFFAKLFFFLFILIFFILFYDFLNFVQIYVEV